MALLDINDLTIEYKLSDGKVRAVDDVTLKVENGDVLGLVGESGCGKTTLIKAVMGLLAKNGKAVSGQIMYKEKDLLKLNKNQIRKVRWNDISMITQSAMNSLNPVYRVGWQINEAILEHTNFSKEQANEKSKSLFDLVGLERDRLEDYPHQYSGGMKQRAIIAMSLALDPNIIIADEPTTALDVIVQSQILERINKLLDGYDGSMILVTHDISAVAQTCNKIAVMYGGKIMEYGDIRQVLKQPNHPYTMGLKNAFPSITGEKKELVSIKGVPPDLSKEIRGCRFKDRCPFVIKKCIEIEPEKVKTEKGFFRCSRYEEIDKIREMSDDMETWNNCNGE